MDRAVGEAVDEFMGAFDIPEQHIVEQAEEAFTIGDNGRIDKTPEESWDPFA